MKTFAFSALWLLLVLGQGSVSADEPETSPDSQIREIGKQYVQAFNDRKSDVLASFWSTEAVYVNRSTGEQVVGRDEIAAQFKELFESEPELKIKVDVESIQFVSPNVAVENGVTTFVSSDSDVGSTTYSAVYVRREGKWLLDRVTDKPVPVVSSHYEQLKELEWMVGTWVDLNEELTVVTDCQWTTNQNFLRRNFSVSVGDEVTLSGIQLIGWDAQAKQIRSWTFDSEGGHAEGTWASSGGNWYVRKKGTTAEGDTVTAVNVLEKVDGDSFTVKSIRRTIGGALLPNLDEVMIVRK